MQYTIKIQHAPIKSATVTAESNSGLVIHRNLADVINGQAIFCNNRWNVSHKNSGFALIKDLPTRQQARQFTSLIPLDLLDSALEYNDITDIWQINDNAIKIIGANIVKRFKP